MTSVELSEVVVAPSLLACNFARIGEEVQRFVDLGIQDLHLDFMDGRFVPNLSFGFPVTEAVARDFPDLKLDVHLMVEGPETYLERLAEMGVSMVSVHWEACPHLHRTLQQIRSLGMKAGVAFNPHTPVAGLSNLLDLLDNVLVMTVNPGFGGQAFLRSMLPKIDEVARLREESGAKFLISVDGGVDERTAPECLRAGADFLVAGSFLFRAQNPASALRALQRPLEEVL